MSNCAKREQAGTRSLPLLVQSGHCTRRRQCPFSGEKRQPVRRPHRENSLYFSRCGMIESVPAAASCRPRNAGSCPRTTRHGREKENPCLKFTHCHSWARRFTSEVWRCPCRGQGAPRHAGLVHEARGLYSVRFVSIIKSGYRLNFLYFSRCGMTLSMPSRRILSAS